MREDPRAATHAIDASSVAVILVNPGPTAGPTKEKSTWGKLRDQMIEDLQLRDYARGTCRAYVDCARASIAYHREPPQQMGEREVRQFLMHLVETKKATPASRKMHVAAIKFPSSSTPSRCGPTSSPRSRGRRWRTACRRS